MANWQTIKQISEKRGVPESVIRGWRSLGYLSFSTINGELMMDDDSLVRYLDAHQRKGLDIDSLNQLIKEKEMEREVILSQLDDELFLLKTQQLHQPLFHVLIQELSQLITNTTHREMFLSISSGEPISRVAERHHMTYDETVAIYTTILKKLGEHSERIATYRKQVLKFMFGKYNTDDPTNVPLMQIVNERACRILQRENIGTVHQLLTYTSQNGWNSLKKFEGMGTSTYQDILIALYNANFIVINEDKSVVLSPEIAALLL